MTGLGQPADGSRTGGDCRVGWTEPADVAAVLQRRWLSGDELSAYAGGEPSCRSTLRSVGRQPAISRPDSAKRRTGRHAGNAPPATLFASSTATSAGRRVGANRIPQRVWVDTPEQLFRHLRVEGDVQVYLDLVTRTRERAPELVAWMRAKPHKVLELRPIWDLLVGTVLWIDEQPDLSTQYLRQLDVPGVDTKFVERHRGILSTLLDLRLPPARINEHAAPTDFLNRYGFRTKPAYVRFRLLDPARTGFSEMTVRTEELATVADSGHGASSRSRTRSPTLPFPTLPTRPSSSATATRLPRSAR